LCLAKTVLADIAVRLLFRRYAAIALHVFQYFFI